MSQVAICVLEMTFFAIGITKDAIAITAATIHDAGIAMPIADRARTIAQ